MGIAILLALIVSVAGAQPLYAQDAGIKVVPFQENKIVALQGKTFTTTQIIFGKEESVLGVEGGDTAGWIVDYKPGLPNMLFIKPTALNSHSNLTVVTNKHNYYFKISSNKTLSTKEGVMYALQFSYPKVGLPSKGDNALLKASNRHYSFHGSVAMKPVQVFDDGTFTYLEFKPHQVIPAVFAVEDAEGKEALVNTRRQGPYLIIQRTCAQFTLRNGSQVGSLFNQDAIRQIREGKAS